VGKPRGHSLISKQIPKLISLYSFASERLNLNLASV